MNKTVKITFCSIVTALSVAVMFLSGLIPIATIAIAALVGCFTIPVVAQCSVKWGFAVYTMTAILSFFFVVDKETVLFYVLFFGYYPVIYGMLSRIKNNVLRYIAKLGIFNVAVLIEGLIATYILLLPIEDVGILGKYTIAVIWVLANIVFFMFDYSLRGIIGMYYYRLHSVIKKTFKIQ